MLSGPSSSALWCLRSLTWYDGNDSRSKRHLVYFIVAGALTSGLPTANMFLCLNYISVGAMSLVLTMVPIFTYLLSLILMIERPIFDGDLASASTCRRAVGGCA